MIQYALKCDNGHKFDSWFGSAAAFDKLQDAGMVTCAVCSSTKVSKELMAPAVSARRKDKDDAGKPAPGPLSAPASPAEQMIAELRKKVESSSEYVGSRFAAEARKMHDGETDTKSIYGEARLDEAKALIDEGVPILPLPFRPSDKSN